MSGKDDLYAAAGGRERLALLSWALYDWANSAYSTIVLTFMFSAYFVRRVAENETIGGAQWSLTLGAAGVLVALGGPLIGAAADQAGRRKPWLALFSLICIAATALLWFVRPSAGDVLPGLLLVAAGQLGMEYAGLLYNAMLPRLVARERLGRWSGWGWSAGYAGGLLALVAALALLQNGARWFGFDEGQAQNIRAAFLLAAGWFAVFAIPLFVFTPDEPPSGKSLRQTVKDGLQQLISTLRQVRRYSGIAAFLIARLIYIDGLATVFVLGGVYAASIFDMSEREVLLLGISLNVTAGLGAAVFAFVDDWIGSKKTVQLSLIGLTVPEAALVLTNSEVLFWIFALLFGVFVGPAQAASRSYLAHVAPAEMRNEMFGLYALSGKAAVLCPLLAAGATYCFNSQRAGMSMVLLFFIGGFLVMLKVPDERER